MADYEVVAKFSADISDMKSKMDQISRGMRGIDGQTTKTRSTLGTLGKGLAVAGTAFIGATAAVGGLYAGLSTLASKGQQAAAVGRTTAQIIKSTGGAAQVTATQVGELADALSRKTGIDDEAIQTGANLLLTFKNVKNEGTGLSAIFDRATTAALDLSKAGFGSVDSASKMLGKALNDPMKGLTALSRAGVTFTEQQKEQITAMVESGNVLGAQKAILAEVESQVGGVAEATRSPIEAIQTMLGNLVEDVGKTLLPIFNQIADALGPVLEQLAPPLAEIAKMLGGVLVSALQALTPMFQPVADAVASLAGMLGPVLTGIIQALVPVVTPIIEIIGQLADILGPVLTGVLTAISPLIQGLGGVIAALAPAFLAIFQALAPVVEMLAGALGTALTTLVPLVVKIADILANVLTKALEMLAPYWESLASIIGTVLNAVLPPLVDVLMTLLDALMPILDPLMEIAALFIEMATPIMELVGVLAPLVAIGIKLIAAVLTPLIEVVGKVITTFVRWISQALKPAQDEFKKAMPVILKWASTAVRAAAELIRQYGKMVKFLIDNVFKKILDAAVESFGWIPGIGDALKTAQANFNEFASSTISNIEGVAGELDSVANQLDTMAQGYTVPVSVQVTTTYDESSKLWIKEGAKPPTPRPAPAPVPRPTPTGGGGGGGGGADDKEKKILDRIEKFVDRYRSALERMVQGRDAIMATVERSPFASLLGDFERSEIQDVFGKTGSIGQVISSYDQLGAGLEDLYRPMMDAELFGKKAAKSAKANLREAKATLNEATGVTLALMKQREENIKALENLDKDYAEQVKGINDTYDVLDKAAAKSLNDLQDKWDGIIPGLESALESATAAFDKENNVLQGLISERDNFLSRIGDGFRSFLNDLKGDSKAAGKQIITEVKQIGDGITVTLQREIEMGGSPAAMRESLNARLTAIREFAANIRTLMERGLDPTLVQDFVAQGVTGAGDIAKTLAGASSEDIAAINQAQTALASEVASFQQYASKQWFDAGIAQQEAIVSPLATARDAAKAALDTANATRKSELEAAQKHIDNLKVLRENALTKAQQDYDAQKKIILDSGTEIEGRLETNAINLHNSLANLQNTVPPELFKAGKKSINALLDGFQEKFPGVKDELNGLMDRLAGSMNRVSTITVRTVYEAAGSLPARAMGGPVSARTAYLVGERGPEVFVPGSAGNILPNNAIRMPSVPSPIAAGSGGSVVVTNHYTVNVQSLAGDKRQIGREVVEAIRAFEKSSGPVYQPASV